MKWCYGCFQPIADETKPCPYCGFSLQSYNLRKWILMPGTILNGKYLVGRTLGEGGFGITYLAWDINMQTRTAIKEYYPGNMVSRDTTSGTGNLLTTTAGDRNGDFEVGLKRYVNEAAILARFFELPGIVSVKDFFYENGTAYIVMEYIDGVSLKKYLEERGGRVPAKEALELIRPLISSLAVIHRNKLLHRDISPDNIMLEHNGTIKLIDFGAARYFDGEGDKSMTVMLKHGYAPIEQYSRKGEQGAGTDIYGLCAVLYRMITGQVPVEAAERIRQDQLVPVRRLAKRTPRYVAAAIEKGLSVLAENRQQSMEELYAELYSARKVWVSKQTDRFQGFLKKLLIAIIICLVLVFIGEIVYFFNRDKIHDFGDRVRQVFGAEEELPEEEELSKENGEEPEETGEENAKDREAREEENQSKTLVPNIIDDTEDKAREKLKEAKLSVGSVILEYDSEIEAGHVITQSIQAGTEVIEETAVHFVVSKGMEHPASVETYAVTVVRDGVLNGRSQDMTVGDILDSYADAAGIWNEYTSQDRQTYVNYQGTKGGDSFTIEFQVYADDTFKVTGATQNDRKIDTYSDFFQEILDEVGVS